METKPIQDFIEKLDSSILHDRDDLLEEFMLQTNLTEEEKKFLRLFSEAQFDSGMTTNMH